MIAFAQLFYCELRTKWASNMSLLIINQNRQWITRYDTKVSHEFSANCSCMSLMGRLKTALFMDHQMQVACYVTNSNMKCKETKMSTEAIESREKTPTMNQYWIKMLKVADKEFESCNTSSLFGYCSVLNKPIIKIQLLKNVKKRKIIKIHCSHLLPWA